MVRQTSPVITAFIRVRVRFCRIVSEVNFDILSFPISSSLVRSALCASGTFLGGRRFDYEIPPLSLRGTNERSLIARNHVLRQEESVVVRTQILLLGQLFYVIQCAEFLRNGEFKADPPRML